MYFNPVIPSNYSNYGHAGQALRTGEVLIANRGLEHINCILPSDGNKGALFLGDVVSTLKTQLLEKHQIKSILSCMVEPISSHALQKYITAHKILPLRDTMEFPIMQYFKQSCEFINESRLKGHNVLVHCHAGVSRSATVVCAYLMTENGWDFNRAIEYVREKRYRAKPNANFVNQLMAFYNEHVLIGKQQQQQATTFTPIDNGSINNTKAFRITLDLEVETHTELLSIEERKQQNHKDKISNHGHNQSVKYQTNHTHNDNKRSINGLRGHQNKSEIHFNRAYDPEVRRLNYQNNDNKNQGLFVGRQRNGYKNKLYDADLVDDPMAKSMINPAVVQNPSYLTLNSPFHTPHKSKPGSVNVGYSTEPNLNVFQPLIMHNAFTPTSHAQKNNINRFSLTGGGFTSYKKNY